MTKTLTPETFDSAVTGPSQRRDRPRVIWTLKAIGQCAGRGEDFARRLADQPGSPVRRHGRQFYADETELLEYLGLPPDNAMAK